MEYSRVIKRLIDDHQAVARRLVTIPLLFASVGAYASTVVVVKTTQGIAIAADSLREVITPDMSGNFIQTGQKIGKKFVIVKNRVVIASVGHGQIMFAGGMYDFPTWVNEMQRRWPNDISVSGVADAIQTESSKIFATFTAAQVKAFKPQSPASTFYPFIEYIVAGVQNGAPTLFVVEIYIDWNRDSIVAPNKVSLPIGTFADGHTRAESFGVKEAITDIMNGNSYAYHRAVALSPKAFGNITSHRSTTIDDAVSLARSMVKIEEETNPSSVGGVIRDVEISTDGRARELVNNYPKSRGEKH